jgi:hypothetical protein
MGIYFFRLEVVLDKLRMLGPSLFLFLLAGALLLGDFFGHGFLLLGATLSNRRRCCLLGYNGRRHYRGALLDEAGLAASDAPRVERSLLGRSIQGADGYPHRFPRCLRIGAGHA